jgi:hypothetical protein
MELFPSGIIKFVELQRIKSYDIDMQADAVLSFTQEQERDTQKDITA